MKYTVVDKEKYYRKEYYQHFTQGAKCSVSITQSIDVTKLLRVSKESGSKFYINFLYLLSKTMNSRDDYKLGYFFETDTLVLLDKISPEHYVFHDDTETFTAVHTEYDEDYKVFYDRCAKDIEEGKKRRDAGFLECGKDIGYFDASCIPWIDYNSLNIELPDGYLYFAPIVNWGKYHDENGKMKMPVTVRMNHAVGDGYHLAKFFMTLQKYVDEFGGGEKKQPKLNIVLVEPRIPQNTGNVSRTCAVTGAALHMIKPYGFVVSDRQLKRAGLDYWDKLEIYEYDTLDEFFKKTNGEYYFFTSKGKRVHSDVKYPTDKEVFLVFGREDAGLPEKLLYENENSCVRMPMKEGLRCLNLSNSVAVGAYEVLRQWNYPNMTRQGELTEYKWEDEIGGI